MSVFVVCLLVFGVGLFACSLPNHRVSLSVCFSSMEVVCVSLLCVGVVTCCSLSVVVAVVYCVLLFVASNPRLPFNILLFALLLVLFVACVCVRVLLV